MRRKFLISAGEASGDLYASLVARQLRVSCPEADMFGCTGPRLRAEGVRTVVDAASLSVLGLAEVVTHIPRIYAEYRRLVAAAEAERPDVAILTDSSGFHLRVARQLRKRGIPVVYLVAPQAWAWRKGRVKQMRRDLTRLLCIFPFEEPFFRKEGVAADYIGHPLAGLVRPSLSREEFFRKHGFQPDRPLVAALPGSRPGETARHMPALLDAIERMNREQTMNWAVPAPTAANLDYLRQAFANSPVVVMPGESWDAMAHADLALLKSGTVTVEAALLGTPMVSFYRVSAPTWYVGRPLVNVPFYSMVNLIAGRALIPELIQHDMTGERIAAEGLRLLREPTARDEMKAGLAGVREHLSGSAPAAERAAAIIQQVLEGQDAHAM